MLRIILSYLGSTLCNASFKNCIAVTGWLCSWSGTLALIIRGMGICYFSLLNQSSLVSLLLPHIVLVGVISQADDIRNEANELLRIRDYLFKELAKNTGQPVEKV
ncbi:hypothetical protein Ancab_032538 [Ancistrocladus abbreviatus]